MKRWAAAVMAALLLLGCALAEELTEYSDGNYSFRHPADWNREILQEGTVILKSPDEKAYVRAGILLMDLFVFTGDAETDAPLVGVVMNAFGGDESQENQSGMILDGSYELVTAGGLPGFRAPGMWKETREPALLTAFTGGGGMAYFLLIGEAAIGLEETLTSSLVITEHPVTAENGMKKWESETISLCYPENFRMMNAGQDGGVVFTDVSKQSSMINVMTIVLPDAEYSDDYGLATMNKVLSQISDSPAEAAEIREIGGRNVVAAEGTVYDTPGAVYVLGREKTAVVLIFAGAETVSQAEAVITSLVIK